MNCVKKPELLAPAGTMKSLNYAFAFGADAVYAGQPRYSLRVRNNEFHGDALAEGIARTHKLGKQFFLTVNTMPHNSKLKTFLADMEPVIEMQPDALIMADPGLIMMIRERWPEMPIHLSVQANTVNFAAVKFWRNMGVERIILSRELSLDEIEEIRQECPETELEVFFTGRFVSPIQAAVCYLVTLTIGIPIKVLVPTLVVGSTRLRPPQPMPKAFMCLKKPYCQEMRYKMTAVKPVIATHWQIRSIFWKKNNALAN